MDGVAALRVLLSRIPLTEAQQEQASELIKKCSSEQLASLGLGPPAKPVVPRGLEKLSPLQRHQAIQRVISSLEYNHAPGYLYNVDKSRPLCRIMDTARDVLREALPIKCIEATFLGVFLTNGWEDLDRCAVGFKSKAAGQEYKHIVLAVHHVPTGKWGALGISRRPELMFKELAFDSLADLIADFKAGYEKWKHTMFKVRVGLPIEHDAWSKSEVCWRYCNVSSSRHPWPDCAAVLNNFAENARALAARFKILGYRPDLQRSSSQNTSGTTPEPGAGTGSTSNARATASPTRAAALARAAASVSPSKRRQSSSLQPSSGASSRQLRPTQSTKETHSSAAAATAEASKASGKAPLDGGSSAGSTGHPVCGDEGKDGGGGEAASRCARSSDPGSGLLESSSIPASQHHHGTASLSAPAAAATAASGAAAAAAGGIEQHQGEQGQGPTKDQSHAGGGGSHAHATGAGSASAAVAASEGAKQLTGQQLQLLEGHESSGSESDDDNYNMDDD